MKLSISLSVMAVLFLTAIGALAQPPVSWTQTYGGSQNDRCYSMQQTADCGFIMAGITLSFGSGEWDMYLVKTDSLGIQEWQQTFGGSGDDRCYSVQQTEEGGYILGGCIVPFGAVNWDMYLVKTDPLGNLEWDITFGDIYSDICYSVQQTPDGGYILGGCTREYGGTGEYVMYLVKTDSLGNLEWDQTYGGDDQDVCMCIQQTPDGGYILGGYTRSFGSGCDDAYLVKTDSLGNQEWDQTYGGTSWDYIFWVEQTSDGGYIMGGYTESFGVSVTDMYLVKADSLGNQEWYRTFGGSSYDKCRCVHQTADEGYILGGATWSTGAGLYDMWLMKTDSQGNLVWDGTYGGSDHDWCESLLMTPFGGYIMAGYTFSFGAGGMDMYLVRLQDEGVPEIEITLTPHDPPIQIPSGGGSFQFDVEIVHTGTGWCTIDVWTDVTSPGGYTFPIMQREDIMMTAGQTISRPDLTQFVPGTASAGMYSYNAYVWDNSTWTVYAEDSFPFEKLSGDDASTHNFGWALCGWDEEVKSIDNPTEYSLLTVYPNPFNLTTTISYQLPERSLVDLAIFDVSGRLIAEVVNGWRDVGVHRVTFNASYLPSGVYLARLTAGDFQQTRKLLLIK